MHENGFLQRMQTLPHGYPSVTIMVPTVRTVPEKSHNITKIRNACKKVGAMLDQQNVTHEQRSRIEQRLEQVITEYEQEGIVGDGVIFLVNEHHGFRQVVTGACPDVVHVGSYFALHALIPLAAQPLSCGALVLAEDKARFINCTGVQCGEIVTPLQDAHGNPLQGFPLTAPDPEDRKELAYGIGDLGSQYRTERLKGFMRLVANELYKLLQQHSAHVIVIASAEVYSAFAQTVRDPHAIIGHVDENHIRAHPHDIYALMQPVLQMLQQKTQEQVLAQFHAALKVNRQAAGLQWVWEVVQEGRVHTLLVEEGYQQLGRIDPENPRHLQQFEHDTPGVILDNLIDVVIAHVWRHRGHVVVVPKDTLQDAGRIGAMLRY